MKEIIGGLFVAIGIGCMYASYLGGTVGFIACIAAVVGIGSVTLATGLWILGISVGVFVASLIVAGIAALAFDHTP